MPYVRESKWITAKFALTDYDEILKQEEPTLLKRSYRSGSHN